MEKKQLVLKVVQLHSTSLCTLISLANMAWSFLSFYHFSFHCTLAETPQLLIATIH